MADILADSQTEAALADLERGSVTDSERDRILAAVLRSQSRIIDTLADIRANLWSVDRLETFIDRRHQDLCARCPARAQPAHPKGWLADLLSSETFRYFILVVVLVWAVIYMRTGVEGVESVRDAAVRTVTGVAK